MTDAETTDSLTELSIKLAPVLSEHEDNISLNQTLFKRINDVYQQKDSLNLTIEQQRLLDKTYKSFVRSGATSTQNNKLASVKSTRNFLHSVSPSATMY